MPGRKDGSEDWLRWSVGAFIGLLGAGGGIVALLGYLAPVPPPPTATAVPVPTKPFPVPTQPFPGPAAITPTIPSISGVWRDVENPSAVSRINADGGRFDFTRQGILPNGVVFESAGSGVFTTGQSFTTSYSARYGSGLTSTGTCSGTMSTSARQMTLACRDSLLGVFSVSAVRQ